jgi:uncharacterized membrane protein (UPF0127 family)
LRPLCLAAVLLLVPLAGNAAASAAPAATKDCANAHLPRAILDGDPAAHAAPELKTVAVTAPDRALKLAVAANEHDRELGLMCVTALKADAGMIFVFPAPGQYAFWMKNTLIPLDMVWVDAGGTVTTVAAAVPASTRDEADAKVARRGGHGSYVIELRSGDAARNDIVKGTHLALPRLAASE